MVEGVILFFSPCERMAHIWCVLDEVPLCLAYRDDFPQLWRKLQIGTRVQLRAHPVGKLMRASDMRLFQIETTNCG